MGTYNSSYIEIKLSKHWNHYCDIYPNVVTQPKTMALNIGSHYVIAFSRIMEDRKGQENFQLIVITHDERFAQMIGQRQHAEKYYRVAKDDM